MIFDRHPSPIELSRAVSEGPSRKVAAHLQRCATCAGTLAEWRDIDSLARELPSLRTSAERRERALAAVLREERTASAPQRARPTWVWGSLAGAAVAALVLVVGGSLLTSQPAPPPVELAQGPTHRGTIRPHAGARFTLESGAPDEVVRLHEGTISVDVEALRPGERFRVIVGDGEVEVRGTSFDVTAMGDSLAKVLVDHGVVEVRAGSRQVVVLVDGESWEATADRGVEEAPIDVPVPSPKRRPVAGPPDEPAPEPTVGAASPEPPSVDPAPPRHPMAELFDRGWKQLRDGRPQEAAQTFGEALSKYPADPLAEDASFWRAVALVRAQSSKEALGALTSFLDAYPKSNRIGETSALLGWILLGKGDVDGAEARFHAAEADPVPSVRASAQKGLEAARAMRHNQTAPR